MERNLQDSGARHTTVRDSKPSSLYCKALKGGPAMQTSPQSLADTPRDDARNAPRPSAWAERAYQCLTIAFMLLLLASLWLFR
jgi:hypothetical protein